MNGDPQSRPTQRLPAQLGAIGIQRIQHRIADLAATGHTTKQIAAQLSLSPRTVDNHLYRLFPKLGIANRAGLSEALRQCDARVTLTPEDSAAS